MKNGSESPNDYGSNPDPKTPWRVRLTLGMMIAALAVAASVLPGGEEAALRLTLLAVLLSLAALAVSEFLSRRLASRLKN